MAVLQRYQTGTFTFSQYLRKQSDTGVHPSLSAEEDVSGCVPRAGMGTKISHLNISKSLTEASVNP